MRAPPAGLEPATLGLESADTGSWGSCYSRRKSGVERQLSAGGRASQVSADGSFSRGYRAIRRGSVTQIVTRTGGGL